MPAEVRARAEVLRGGKRTRKREVVVTLSHSGVSMRFVDGKLGEDFFSFSLLEDLGFLPPFPCDEPNFTLRFSDDRVLILSVGDNPLIYDRGKFEAFIHRIFVELLNGVPVFVRKPGEDWNVAYLRVIGPGRLLAVGKEGERLISFSSVGEASCENGVWRLRVHSPYGTEEFEVKIEERKVRLFVLRYLQRFSPLSWGYLADLSREFPWLERELRCPELEPVEREVLDALLTGIDPLEVPRVLRMDPIDVERIYDSLIRKGLLRIKGIRKVVEPTPLARKLKEGGEG